MTSRGIVFLMYHEIELPGRPVCQSEPGYMRYVLPEVSFRSQMEWLRANGWSGLNVGAALSYPTGHSVAITFDDGCETDLLAAAPILRENRLNATFYVTTGFIGRPGYMSPGQLRELSDLGFEIGCHSMTHAYLNDLDESALRREISDAGKQLEQITGRNVEHFSCPGGCYNARVLDSVRRAGYRSLTTSYPQVNHPSTHPFLLGRVAIMRNSHVAAFARLCNGYGLKRIRLNQFVRGTARAVLGNALYDRLRRRMLQ
jgi:peptidoglycan/xylan/chitin deacetylase (PgdA/CDA1 family)